MERRIINLFCTIGVDTMKPIIKYAIESTIIELHRTIREYQKSKNGEDWIVENVKELYRIINELKAELN